MIERANRYGKYVIPLAALAVAAAAPFFVEKFTVTLIIEATILSIGTMSLNIIMGYAGQVSLAQGAFYGIGAYGLALLTSKAHLNFWVAVVLACLITAAVGFLIGLLAFRTRGPYFVIMTLCFNFIVYIVVKNWNWLSGGDQGQKVIVPAFLEGRDERYYLVLALALITLFVMWRISRSLQGLALFGIRSNEDLAGTLGVNTTWYKIVALMASCFLVGLAGCLSTLSTGGVSPDSAHYLNSFYFIIYLLVGGVATLYGPIIGTFVVVFALEYMKGLGEYRYMIFGIILILVVIYFPRGLAGGARLLWEKLEGWLKRPKKGNTPDVTQG